MLRRFQKRYDRAFQEADSEYPLRFPTDTPSSRGTGTESRS